MDNGIRDGPSHWPTAPTPRPRPIRLAGVLVANRNFLLYLPAIRFPNQHRGHESRHRGQTPPTGPDPSPGKPARSGYSQDNAPIPVSIPLGVIGRFPVVFAPGWHSSMSRLGLGFDTQRFTTYNCTQRDQRGMYGRPTLSLLDIRTGRRRNNQPPEATP